MQDQVKKNQVAQDRECNASALRVIEMLDLIETLTLKHVDADPTILVQKLKKKLIELLSSWQVKEIQIKDGRVEVGKTRVLETRSMPEPDASGRIIAVCRKGYSRGDKTIRPVDVISAL